MDDDLERIQQATNRCYYYHQLSKKWVMLRVQTHGQNARYIKALKGRHVFELGKTEGNLMPPLSGLND